MDQTYDKLNDAWKTTCNILFKDSVGELKDYEVWLRQYLDEKNLKQSKLSNKDVYLSNHEYSDKSKFIGYDEIDFNKKYEPLNINEIKDIDSIVEAVQERIYYTGNVVLGNSHYVQKSCNVLDSCYVYESNRAYNSKCLAYTDLTTDGKYLFGFYDSAVCNYCISGTANYILNRCFECHMGTEIHDCYYSSNLIGCRECMFSFGAVSRNFLIGNLPVPKSKYLSIKHKLLSEMCDKLKKDKKLFSLSDILYTAKNPTKKLNIEPSTTKQDIKPVEEAFARTSSTVLGKPLGKIDDYSGLLQKHVPPITDLPSAFTNQKTFHCYSIGRIFSEKGKKRALSELEIKQVGNVSIEEHKLNDISFDLNKIVDIVSDIAFFSGDVTFGNNFNIIESPATANSRDCYKINIPVSSKKCAYGSRLEQSENMFGSLFNVSSSFCINSYYSKKLTRCMEVDSCDNCTDLYYGHNCENVHDSMFCFNVKNLRNAIGNAPLPQNQYLKIKQMLKQQLIDELEEKKDLKWDIYNLSV